MKANEILTDIGSGYSRPKKHRCLCHSYSRPRIYWDIFIMIVATFVSFFVPYTVAFNNSAGDFDTFDIIDMLIDIVFLIDIIVNFRTTYIDQKASEEIKDWDKIAKNYIKGKFWIDFIVIIPFNYIELFISLKGPSIILFISVMKLTRISKLTTFVTFLNLHNEVRTSLKLAKLVFYLVLYSHLVS